MDRATEHAMSCSQVRLLYMLSVRSAYTPDCRLRLPLPEEIQLWALSQMANVAYRRVRLALRVVIRQFNALQARVTACLPGVLKSTALQLNFC